MLDCREIRSWFPTLRERDIAFLDNAASTLKPDRVLDAMHRFAAHSYANVHRGVYELSLRASEAYEEAHDTVARLIGARGREEIVFTSGTTGALHLAAQLSLFNGIVGEGDEIIISAGEHHSNMIPWYRIARLAGARVRTIPLSEEGTPRWDLLPDLLNEKTKIVAVGHVSNVTGYESPVAWIARQAKKHGALVVVDGAQSVPHIPVNVEELGIDMLAFSGHKMLGPTGIGVLWIRRELAWQLEPPLGGGGTVARVELHGDKLEVDWEEPPWRFEAGTPPIIEAIGLAEASMILMELGTENIANHEANLVSEALELLEEKIPDARLIGPRDPSKRRGIVSFTIPGYDPDLIGVRLSQHGIAVRTGLHCAHPLHAQQQARHGSIRASYYIYNCPEDTHRLVEALGKIIRD